MLNRLLDVTGKSHHDYDHNDHPNDNPTPQSGQPTPPTAPPRQFPPVETPPAPEVGVIRRLNRLAGKQTEYSDHINDRGGTFVFGSRRKRRDVCETTTERPRCQI